MVQHSPLESEHRALGATLVEFGGHLMPLQYGSIRQEHEAVRGRAGLFDVSHMGEIAVTGRGALAFVQELVTNDIGRLEPGQAAYTLMCRPDGGIVDDLLVYRGVLDDDPASCLLVVNAGRRAHDLAWIGRRVPASGVTVEDRSDRTALVAVQGPRAAAILEPLTAIARGPDGARRLTDVGSYRAAGGTVAGVPAIVSRTGYTGEDGFEIYCDGGDAVGLWRELLRAGEPEGLRPAGLGARDTLRLEAGFRLHGQDMDESTDPYRVGLGWTVKLGKGPFVGRETLLGLRRAPRARVLAGLRLGPRAIPRHGQAVLRDGDVLGSVTSGGFGFTVGGGIALASLPAAESAVGTALAVDVRGAAAPAEVVSLPFYRRPG